MSLRTNSSRPHWLDQAAAEAWERAQKSLKSIELARTWGRYQDDPVGFGIDVFGDYYTDDLRAISESVRDNPVTVARSSNAVGKSWVAARLALWYFCVFPDAKVYITAAPPLENLKHVLWGEIGAVIENRPNLFGHFKTRSMGIFRDKKSFILGVAIPTSGTAEEREAKFSGKHAPHIMFIVDEGDAVPDEIYKGIESCMSGGSARMLVLFNPRAKSGPVYFMEKNGQANVVPLSALDHPNVREDKDIVVGAVTRSITVRRINEWSRGLITQEEVKEDPMADYFEVPDFLVGSTATALDGRTYPPLQSGLRKIINPQFSYMVLGKYPSQSSSQLISDLWVERAVENWRRYVEVNGEIPPAGVAPILGVDIAELGTDFNVGCRRYGDYVARFDLWNGVDADMTAGKALSLYQQYGAKIAMIDAMGVGSGVAPSMARRGRGPKGESRVRAVGVKVAERPSPVIKSDLGTFRFLRDQLWWAVREWLRTNENAMLPPDGFLMEELKLPEYEIPDGKIRITSKEDMRKRLKRSPDRADALCLTFAPFAAPTWVRLDEASPTRLYTPENRPTEEAFATWSDEQ